MWSEWTYCGRAMADLIMPRECMVCGTVLGVREDFLCIRCAAGIPFTYYWDRRHNPMADQFNALWESRHPESPRIPYIQASSLFYYLGDYQKIPKSIKYHANLGAGRYFGRMLGSKLAGVQWWQDIDRVVPVPLHWSRRWSRGYNQAEIIGKALADVLGVPCDTALLKRTRRTRTQTRLSGENRAGNVASAFGLLRPPPPGHILLLDDTFTTGATLFACRETLMQAGEEDLRVSVATLAVVP